MYRTWIALMTAGLAAMAQEGTYFFNAEASNLKEVQDTVLKILRSATSSDNYATALAAQSQARAIVRTLGQPALEKGTQTVTPAVSQLQEVQSTVIRIMRKAHFEQDYRTALIAASQATHIARILRRATGERQVESIDPQVRELQRSALTEMRKATFEGNHQIALAAAAQAIDNAELLGVLTGEITPDVPAGAV